MKISPNNKLLSGRHKDQQKHLRQRYTAIKSKALSTADELHSWH